MRTIRFGIIGGGLMGREIASAMARWAHLLDVPARPQLVGICGRRREPMDWFTHNFETIKQATTDYRELLKNPEIDAIYCAVPHNLHEEIYCAIHDAGKHLLGEKPFGIDRCANARITSTAAAHPDLVVRSSSQFPFFPPVQRIVRLLREQRFGRILEVEAGFLHCSDMDVNKPINWKRQIATNGEYGCMGDLGLHVFHVPLRVGWMPANLRAILSKVVPQRPDDKGNLVPCETWDNATLMCEVPTADGSFPLVAKMQRIAPGETNTWYLTIKGTRLSARFTTRQPRTLWTMPYEPPRPQAWQEEAMGYESIYKAITGGIFEFGFTDSIQQMLAAFCHQIVEGPQATLPFGCATVQEAAATHAIFTAALQSHNQRKVVEL